MTRRTMINTSVARVLAAEAILNAPDMSAGASAQQAQHAYEKQLGERRMAYRFLLKLLDGK